MHVHDIRLLGNKYLSKTYITATDFRNYALKMPRILVLCVLHTIHPCHLFTTLTNPPLSTIHTDTLQHEWISTHGHTVIVTYNGHIPTLRI